MKIKKVVYENILYDCPIVPPETGGILGGHPKMIDTVVFDAGNKILDSALYVPDVKKLNSVLVDWQREGIIFFGLFHSHPTGQETLSQDDIRYINAIMLSLPPTVSQLYFPIVIPKSHIIFYKAKNQNHNILITRDNIKIVP